MGKPIQREPEMQQLKRGMSFASAPKDEINEGAGISIKDPDTILTTIVLLLACLALALLAGAVI
jgi:hypothetical protein